MSTNQPLALLGGLSPAQFMRRHWHKKPLLVRGAVPPGSSPIDRRALFALAAQPDVESRLVQQGGRAGWSMRQGPFTRRALPPRAQRGWTLLVQGLDLHHAAAHALLSQFRFVPDARLDDLMVSFATDGGGVGPHFDSYDVFLLQVEGRRRWRIGAQRDLALRDGLPLKILADFQPDAEYVLEPGDMLYLPPRYAHDGVAEGDCMTCSIGFRAPTQGELAAALLDRLVDADDDVAATPRYRDPKQAATDTPGAIPEALSAFARDALEAALRTPGALERALGEYLTEPKGSTWFDGGDGMPLAPHGLRLDRRTRMAYDARHIFINGESFRAAGRDARLMRQLADARCLGAASVAAASADAQALLADWAEAGWLHADAPAQVPRNKATR